MSGCVASFRLDYIERYGYVCTKYAAPTTLCRISLSHHIATDDADPRDAHNEREDVVLLVLRPGAVRYCEAERHHKGQAKDEQEALHPSLWPREPVVLRMTDRWPIKREKGCQGYRLSLSSR